MNAAAASAAHQREGIRYVRTFLFSMQIDSPLARLHIATKFIGVLLISLVIVRQMSMHDPDPAGAVVLAVLSLVALLMSGALVWLFRSYLFVIFPMLTMLFITWLIFNPDRGTQVYLERQLYDGTLTLALSASLAALVLFPMIYYRLARSLSWGLVGGLALALALTWLKLNPRLVLAEVPFFHPLSLIVSDKNLVVAATKVFGYATMVFLSLTLVMTTRDAETLAAIRDGLWMAVNAAGTARRARIPGRDVAGKTGTAQVISVQGRQRAAGQTDRDLRDHGWFVFLAPRDNPRIAGVVFAEHAEHGYLAAPIARHVMETYFAKLEGRPLPQFVPAQPAAAIAEDNGGEHR